MKSPDCAVITQRRSATEQRLPQGRKESMEGTLGVGARGGEEVKEVRKRLEANEISPALIFHFFFFLSGDTITGASF